MNIIQAINEISVVTPFSLVCAALLTYPRKGVYRRELLKSSRCSTITSRPGRSPWPTPSRTWSRRWKRPWRCAKPASSSPPSKRKKACRTNWGWAATASTRPSGPFWSITKTTSSISSCLPPSSPWPSWRGQGFEFERRQVLDDFRFLEDFFKIEFFFSGITPEALLDETLAYFTSRGVVVSLDGGDNRYTLSASGLKELAYFANLLYNYLESYWLSSAPSNTCKKSPGAKRNS